MTNIHEHIQIDVTNPFSIPLFRKILHAHVHIQGGGRNLGLTFQGLEAYEGGRLEGVRTRLWLAVCVLPKSQQWLAARVALGWGGALHVAGR
jgi:hypothetical protein